jgi:small subunit ribosomal protein S6
MKRPYETCVVFDGTLSDDAVAREQQDIEKLLKKDARLEQVLAWGKRRLASEIRGIRTGIYYLFLYESEGDVPVQLEKRFKLNANVLRHLTVRRDGKTEAAQRPVAEKAEGEETDAGKDEPAEAKGEE